MILCKKPDQRSASEQKEVLRGLGRAIVLESLLFVPVSAALGFMVFPWLISKTSSLAFSGVAPYSLLGMVSYGFPFATLRRVVTKFAFTALQHQLEEEQKRQAATRG
jgi:hypothetical protein